MKKIISFIVATVMIFSLSIVMAGCGGLVQEYSWQINWDVDLSKPIELTAMYPETSLSSFGTDDTASIIEKTTGYKVNYEQLSGTGDNEIQNILTNPTDQKYHFLKLTEAQYHPYLEGGTFLDLTELLEKTESGRKIYDIINLMPYGWDAVTYVDSEGVKHIYGIPDFGYCVMEDSALIWNVDHLRKIGYVNEDNSVKVPKTIEEFTDALYKCQAFFGSNSKYHAFDIPGENSCMVTPLTSAFNVPLEFYLDENNQIQQYIFSDATIDYAKYMSQLYKANILSPAWGNDQSSTSCTKFANGECSVTYQPYWYVTALVNTIVAKGNIASALGISNDYRTVHDQAIAWTTRVRGDGTNGSPVQEKAMIHGGDAGISYYTVIQASMAEYALYIIDFLGKKIENFDMYYGGEEGVHWTQTATPAGAKDYYEDGDYGYQQYETYEGANSVIYLRPYSYTYRVGEQKADGTYATKTVTGGGKWVKLTQRYLDHIVDNSQYCNGTNKVSANVLFHLRETGFDAWQVTVPMDDTIITNPMTMACPFPNWSIVSILARTQAKRGVSSSWDKADPEAAIKTTRQAMRATAKRADGKVYYYWSDDIVNEMTNWYINVKLNRN